MASPQGVGDPGSRALCLYGGRLHFLPLSYTFSRKEGRVNAATPLLFKVRVCILHRTVCHFIEATTEPQGPQSHKKTRINIDLFWATMSPAKLLLLWTERKTNLGLCH